MKSSKRPNARFAQAQQLVAKAEQALAKAKQVLAMMSAALAAKREPNQTSSNS